MYILAKDNQVFYGPNKWNPKLIESFIEDEFEIEMTVSPSAPETNTNIGNDIIAYKLVDVQVPEHNPKIQQPHGPFYELTDVAIQTFQIVDKNVDDVKKELAQIVADLRWKKEISGVNVTIQNTELKVTTNRGERDIYLQALQSGIDGNVWKLVDTSGNNVWLTLSLTDLQSIVTAIISHIQSAFDWEKSKNDEINAATDLVTLDAIVIEGYTDLGV